MQMRERVSSIGLPALTFRTSMPTQPKPISAKSTGATPPAPAPQAVAAKPEATTQVAPQRSIEDVLKARMMIGQGVKPPMPRMLKINYDEAVSTLGSFVISEQTIDAEGNSKTIFKPLAEKLQAVVLKIRLQVKGEYNETAPAIYSYEFYRNHPVIELRQGNALIARGDYKSLKDQYGLVYFVILYLWLPDLK